MTNPVCPGCEQNHYVIKAGRNRSKTQRYRCQHCQAYFTPQPKPLGYAPELKAQALQLYLEGTSFRAIGRLLGVHNQSVINWINAAEKQLPPQVSDTTPTDYIEIDELFSFVQAKKKRFTS
jgi:transposase-like protein